MWSFKSTILHENVYKFTLYEDDIQLSYENVVRGWLRNGEFREFYFSTLRHVPFEAFFWENPPVTNATIKQVYEFVLVNSPQLAGVTADPNPFQENFKADQSSHDVISFENLGRDALLIVPRPINSTSNYAHFRSFLRNAPVEQKHHLFVKTAQSLFNKIADVPTWVSTSGLGVYWLHVRLDSRPKYYSYQPYR